MRELRTHTVPHAVLAGLAALTVGLCIAPPALAGGGEPCPNEQLRQEDNSTGLPDCRAYELVSPPFTAGGSFGGTPGIAPDGDRFIYGTDGSYAGATGAENELNEYQYTRTPAGWEVTSLEPPSTVFPSTNPPKIGGNTSGLVVRHIEAASRDLDRTLWLLRKQSSELFSYFLREPLLGAGCPPGATLVEGTTEDACIVEVGPPSPTITPDNSVEEGQQLDGVVGVSSDLSHIVFRVLAPTSSGVYSTKFTWPGDMTTSPTPNALRYSLYEYVGTGQSEPKLVGVKNQHALHSNAEAELISSCETQLGSGLDKQEGDRYNAVSASGETVFFTAVSGTGCTGPVANELYARIDGEKTVALSEPPLTVPGRECTSTCETDETTAADHKPAVFQGASENGEKVFFLTEQPLVNGAVTTPQKQDLYEEELQGGEATNLLQVSHDPHAGQAAEVQGVARVSEDGSRVYFVARGELAENENNNHEKATDGADNLYVYERDAGNPGGRLRFIADLCSASGKSGAFADPQCPATSTTDSTDWEDVTFPSEPYVGDRPVQATPDGEYLVFESVAHLTPGDTTGTTRQVYEYDALTGELARVSVGGCPADTRSCDTGERYGNDGIAGTATIKAPAYGTADNATEPQLHLAVSENGEYVVFEDTGGLVQGAIEGATEPNQNSVYEYRWSEDLANGDVYLIDSGITETVEGASYPRPTEIFGITATGSDVFFSVFGDDALVGQDTNTGGNIFDARIDGGFPAPVAPPECKREECRAPLGAPFGQPAAGGSATQRAGENVAPSPTVTAPATKTTPKPKPLTRAQKLAKALKRCEKDKSMKKRASCQRAARKTYGPVKPKSRHAKGFR